MEKLLGLLKQNARLSAEQLAVMLNVTPEEVAAEIDKLETCGIIKGYSAVVDEEKADKNNVTAYIELKISPQKDYGFDDIAQTIMSCEEVDSVYLMSGVYDLVVIVNGNNFREIALFVSERLASLDGVLSTGTHFILRRYKEKGIIFGNVNIDERGLVSP